jgi:hypothetical protein
MKGSITVFLSLFFSVVVTFLLSMLYLSNYHLNIAKCRQMADLAVFSLFGEYQTNLLDTYGLFAIDGGYRSGEFDEETIVTRLRYYGVDEMEHEVSGICFLTDHEGRKFAEQAIACMESKYGIDIIRDLTGYQVTWEEYTTSGEAFEDAYSRLEDTFLQEVESASNVEGEVESTEQLEGLDTIKEMFAWMDLGIADTVLTEGGVSNQTIQTADSIEMRSLQTGTGACKIRDDIEQIQNKWFFYEYLLSYFQDASTYRTQVEEEDTRLLQYEMEYLLQGKQSDLENLEKTLQELLLVRFGTNELCLQTGTKKAEVEAMSLVLVSALGVPAMQEVLTQLLLAGWAYAESIADLKVLLSGGKLSFIKEEADWQVSLTGFLTQNVTENIEGTQEGSDGWSYADYLRMLCFLKSDETLRMRALSYIEKRIQVLSGAEIYLDQCIVHLDVTHVVPFGRFPEATFSTSFGYQVS